MFHALIPTDRLDDRLATGLPAGSKVYTVDRIKSRLEQLRAENNPNPHRLVEVDIWYNPRLGIVKPVPEPADPEPGIIWSSAAEERPRGILCIKAAIPADLLVETNRGYIPVITYVRRGGRKSGGVGNDTRFTPAQLLEMARSGRLARPELGLAQSRTTPGPAAPPAPKITAPGLWKPGLYAFARRRDYTQGRRIDLTWMDRDVAMEAWRDLPDEATAIGDPFDPDELTAQNVVVLYAAMKFSREGDCLEVLGVHAPKAFDRDWVIGLRPTLTESQSLQNDIPYELCGQFDPATGRLTMYVA